MPTLKLKAKAQEVKSGFEPYDGPEPTKRGFYRAVLKKMTYSKKNSGAMGFFIVLELEAAKGDPKDHARFDSYPMFSRSIITEMADDSPLKEGAQRNLDNLLFALGAGDNPSVVLDKGDVDAGVDVLKIGGKNPVNTVVNIDMAFEEYNGEKRPSVGGIFKYKDEDAAASKGKALEPDEDEEDSDLYEDDEADEAEEATEEDERAEELEGMALAALRKLAVELDLSKSGTKAALVERILEAEFGELAEDDEEEPDEDEADEDEVDESDEAEDDEEEDDEEEDEDESAERRAELQGFDRVALKKVLKEIAPDFTVLKRHNEEDLVEAILDIEFGDDTPF